MTNEYYSRIIRVYWRKFTLRRRQKNNIKRKTKTMKKQAYTAPAIEVHKIALQLMVAQSPMGIYSDHSVNTTNATLLGRGGGDWDDEE